MKTTLAILVLGSLAFATSGANAYDSRANGYQSHWNPDRQIYMHRTYESSGYQSHWNPDRQIYMHRTYESSGYQSHWNPDRQIYMKTSHKHTIKQADRR
jgi:hypothetical protein